MGTTAEAGSGMEPLPGTQHTGPGSAPEAPAPNGAAPGGPLVAPLALVWEPPAGRPGDAGPAAVPDPVAATVGYLAARRAAAVVSDASDWGGLAVVEVALAVTEEGLLLLAGEDGAVSEGQQVEDFAVALKRAVGALYAEIEGIDAESGEPVEDARLSGSGSGTSVLVGRFQASDLALEAGLTRVAWRFFRHAGADVAVCGTYGAPTLTFTGSGNRPVLLLARDGSYFAMAQWTAEQSRKLHGRPVLEYQWTAGSRRALEVPAGSAADVLLSRVEGILGEPEPGLLDSLAAEGLDPAVVDAYRTLLGGTATLDTLRRILELNGYDPALAGLLDGDGMQVPEEARRIAPRGVAQAVRYAVGEDMREELGRARGIKRLLYSPSWPPPLQLAWAVAMAGLCWFLAAGLPGAGDAGRDIPRWLQLAGAAVCGIEALGDGVWAVRRLGARNPTGRASTGKDGGR